MTRKTRIKTAAAAITISDEHMADAAIAQIGNAQRKREEIATRMNAELAAVKERFETEAAPFAGVISAMSEGVRNWCEANRVQLTREGRTKTAKFGAGEVSWRTRPPRVSVRGEGAVIEALKRLGLERFVRRKEEIDKAAILAAPADVQDIKGLTISQGEDFVIKPFSSDIEEVRS